jgi:purine-nucleoside phosphorylase
MQDHGVYCLPPQRTAEEEARLLELQAIDMEREARQLYAAAARLRQQAAELRAKDVQYGR